MDTRNSKIKDVMTRAVETITPEATIREAAEKMDDANVGILPVCDRGRLVGMISDRDIVIRSTSAGQDPNLILVRDTMTSPPIYCSEDQSVDEVIRLMEQKEVRRVPVLNKELHVQGIVSVDDLVTKLADKAAATEVIQRIARTEGPTKQAA